VPDAPDASDIRPLPPRPTAWIALVNPAAGRRRARRLLPRATRALGALDLDLEVVATRSADDLVGRARDACTSGRGVVAVGGDGTVTLAASAVADHDGVLAVVPTGSGNDFGRALGLTPGDVDGAVAAFARGALRRVDLGRAHTADGRSTWFTTVANAGFDGEANRRANEATRLSGPALYVLATLRTLVAYRPVPLHVVAGPDVVDGDGWLVAVGNTPSYASGMRITPEASIADGLLDVCVVGDVTRPDFLRTFPRVFTGTHVRHPKVRTLRAHEVELDAGQPLDLWASGEHVGPLPARLEAVAGALTVVAR
jgi:diacylglycerol kinase (ATP)